MALKEMHPRLPTAWARSSSSCAAIALERRSHAPGVGLVVQADDTERVATLGWSRGDPADEPHLDRHRITEDGAEAVALALVSVAMGWVTLRRMQRGESADWLLENSESTLIALEISGLDGDLAHGRMAQKLVQVQRVTAASSRWACLVAFSQPAAAFAEV